MSAPQNSFWGMSHTDCTPDERGSCHAWKKSRVSFGFEGWYNWEILPHEKGLVCHYSLQLSGHSRRGCSAGDTRMDVGAQFWLSLPRIPGTREVTKKTGHHLTFNLFKCWSAEYEVGSDSRSVVVHNMDNGDLSAGSTLYLEFQVRYNDGGSAPQLDNAVFQGSNVVCGDNDGGGDGSRIHYDS